MQGAAYCNCAKEAARLPCATLRALGMRVRAWSHGQGVRRQVNRSLTKATRRVADSAVTKLCYATRGVTWVHKQLTHSVSPALQMHRAIAYSLKRSGDLLSQHL